MIYCSYEGMINMNFIFSLIACLIILIIVYIPYIMLMGIITMIIWIITTKKIASKTLKTLIIIIILLYTTIAIGSFKNKKPDNTYTKIKEIYDDQTLIGLTEEKVIEILGNPEYEYNNEKYGKEYEYYAGKIFKESYWGYSYTTEYYELYVQFDENGKVKKVLMKLIP